eukprot:3298481-Pleurochrysis_carterae.AAC.1
MAVLGGIEVPQLCFGCVSWWTRAFDVLGYLEDPCSSACIRSAPQRVNAPSFSSLISDRRRTERDVRVAAH